MSIIGAMTATAVPEPGLLAAADAATYASWFACLADPTRVRLLHVVAVAGRAVTVGELTEQLGISQSTSSHHIRKLADIGFVRLRKDGTATLVSVNPACSTRLPRAADVVMSIGKALLHQQITAADANGLWTLQTAIFPENRASLALHHTAGYRTLGVRERIAQHHGRWRDTVFLERRRTDDRDR
jgi:DNA-binding transcriptional ArsR family regulator